MSSQRKATPFAAVFGSPPPPPPLGSLTGTTSLEADSTGYMNDWRRFKEAGFLDQSAMAIKDQSALAEKLSNLETELFDYQYNMGLLLLEKEGWTSKYEELRQALDETHEIMKREKAANVIAYTEVENREANLRNALVYEKQCVAELESALREIDTERAKVKLSADSAVAEASSMLIGIEEKSLELERNSRAAEAKLAEANRKTASLDIRLEELEARESLLQKEQHTFSTEREAHKARFERQREDLREWERKLHEREDKLCKGRRTLVEREEKVNENEKSLSQREMKLQALQKQNDSSLLHLNQKKEDVNKRLEDLISKEKEADSLRMSLEKKGTELELLEEKLSAREKIEVKQLLDDHKAVLDVKMREFDLELEEKRKTIEKELSCKADSVRKKEAEINHRDEMLVKREHAVHERSERLKEKNKEIDERLKSLKDKEKVLKSEERKLEEDKKQLASDKESLQDMLSKVEGIKAENVELERKIGEERKTLIINEKERSDHLQLQLELKQEIEKYRHQNELLSNEATELRLEKESFEKQWEDLGEKKSKISIESKELADEKDKLEKSRKSEERRLIEEKWAAEEVVKRELENLKLQKESFSDTMKSERLALAEEAQLEQSQMVQDLESQRRNLEIEIQSQREKMEKLLGERRRAFEDEKERELENIKRLKEVSHRDMEDVKTERLRIKSKREEVVLSKEKQKADRLEMQSDIDDLVSLNGKIKEQREELARERAEFLAFVEKLKGCNDGEEVARELTVSGFDSHRAAREEASLDMSTLGLNSSKMSWLNKCTTKILKSPPGKKSDLEHSPASLELPPKAEENLQNCVVLGSEGPISSENRPLAVLRKCEKVDDDHHSKLESKDEEGLEESMHSASKSGRRRSSRHRTTSLNRTRSVREAIEEAEAFLGDDSLLPSESHDVSESLCDSVCVGKGKSARKRQRPQASLISESDSEACSVPGGERYNLRSRTNAKTVKAEAESKRRKKECGGNLEAVSCSVSSSGVARKSSATKQPVHVAQTARTVEFSENKVVRFITPDEDTRSEQFNAEITELSAEANNNKDDDVAEEDESGSTVHEGDDEDDDEDDDEVKPGEASVGKKIWKFLTT